MESLFHRHGTTANRYWWRFAGTNLNFHKYDNKQQGKKGLQGVQLRRRRSYGSPHRARLAKGQSSKGPLRQGHRHEYVCTKQTRLARANTYRNQMLLPSPFFTNNSFFNIFPHFL